MCARACGLFSFFSVGPISPNLTLGCSPFISMALFDNTKRNVHTVLYDANVHVYPIIVLVLVFVLA